MISSVNTLVQTNYYISYVDQAFGKAEGVLSNVWHFGLILKPLTST